MLVSNRARRLSLKVEPGRGLVVTIPRRFARRDVPAFVERHRAWIEASLAKIQRDMPERFRQWPPATLSLPAIGQVLEVTFQSPAERATPGEWHASGNIGNQISVFLTGDPADRSGVTTELAAILKALARQYLPVRLAMLAEEQGIIYQRVQIRGQRTRWGSCSSNGTISLNYKLLFLSPALVDYVLLHELAHTRYMDHSPAFWRQLQSMHAEARQLDDQLRLAGRDVPPWLELAK